MSMRIVSSTDNDDGDDEVCDNDDGGNEVCDDDDDDDDVFPDTIKSHD